MKTALHYTLFFACILCALTTVAQTNERFLVRGSVIETDTRTPIAGVSIKVNDGFYTTTDDSGNFRVEVKKGDILLINHQDFETVTYTITNNERIEVQVRPYKSEETYSKSKSLYKKNKRMFKSLIDSADTYLKKDAEKSIQFVTEAITASTSKKENSEAYEVLGDINLYWKQYDLAISNYKISLQNIETIETTLKLANAYKLNKDYDESLQTYKGIDKNRLSNWQLATLYEGLGDVYLLKQAYNTSITSYQDGLKVAQNHLITPKITDLNSKIAEAYSAKGEPEKAQGYFDKSLKLANTQNKKRAVREQLKVADFQNVNSNFSEEINLRKEVLDDIIEMESEEGVILDEELDADNESPLTLQKQNYKIGNAYAAQGDFPNAIPYLEKSIEEAESKNDLIVKKDATRKLSEIYKNTEDYEKALNTFQEYVDLVDQVYIKKEQEIAQAERFRRELTAKQNRIISLESDRALSETKYQLTVEQAKQQKLIIYSLAVGLLLLLLTAFLMFKYIKQQRLANNMLALKGLRSQMNPHFIFNALNSVNSFIALNDERTANTYLTEFSQLMRAVLENSEEDFIPLAKEIELLELYIKLEHFRFKDKFEYTIQIDPHIHISDYNIPPMLLQPYIENAVWHGLRYKKTKGQLRVIIKQIKQGEITIIITDNGIGRAKSKALKTKNQQKQRSKGMGNIEKRISILNTMSKDKVNVSVNDFQSEKEDTGTQVIVVLKQD